MGAEAHGRGAVRRRAAAPPPPRGDATKPRIEVRAVRDDGGRHAVVAFRVRNRAAAHLVVEARKRLGR